MATSLPKGNKDHSDPRDQTAEQPDIYQLLIDVYELPSLDGSFMPEKFPTKSTQSSFQG